MDIKDLIEIIPENENLSLEELRKYRNSKYKPIKIGGKRTKPNGSKEEAGELEDLYTDLRKQISNKRINSPEKLMESVWDYDVGAARVTRKAGKLEKFGFSWNSNLYLEYFEALFLLESGRLILKTCNDSKAEPLSIEAAYCLLLDENKSKKFNDYLVFSHMTKCGYILRRHRKYEPLETRKEFNRNDYIWSLLEEELTGKPLPKSMQCNCTLIESLKQSMLGTKTRIMEQVPPMTSSNHSIDMKFNEKVKQPMKMKNYLKFADGRGSQSFLNIFQNDPNFIKFEEIFQSFNLIELSTFSRKSSYISDYEITFDLYLPNDGFKKSSFKLPTFYILVLDNGVPFPTNEDIVHLQIKKHKVPIMVVSVSDSKQVHAFLYYCSS